MNHPPAMEDYTKTHGCQFLSVFPIKKKRIENCGMEETSIGANIQRLAEKNRPDLINPRTGQVNQSALAAEAGIPQPTLSRIMKGKHVSPRDNNIRPIAAALRSTPAEVRGEHPFDNIPPGSNLRLGPSQIREVPLISWVQAGEWMEAMDLHAPGVSERPVKTTKNVGSRAFALRVVGDSMEPKFPEGSIIIVDPDKAAENGSFVVVRLEDSKEATFKQISMEGGMTYLKPLNTRYPVITIKGEAQICGVVRQLLMDLD